MYKKYILKHGKRIGPYYYDSVRLKDGKIKTIYLGKKAELTQTGKKGLLFFKTYRNELGEIRTIYSHGSSSQFFQQYAPYIRVMVVLIFLCLGGILYLSTESITGFTIRGREELVQPVNLSFTDQQEYTLLVDGQLTGIKLSGSFSGDGSAQVYLNDKEHLILDTNALAFFQQTANKLSQSSYQKKKNKSEEDNVSTLNTTLSDFYVMNEVNATVAVQPEGDELLYSVTFLNASVDQLILTEVVGDHLRYSEAARGILAPDNVTFLTVFSFDLSPLTYTNAQITFHNQGNALYRCAYWDFDLSTCVGEWERIEGVGQGDVSLTLDHDIVAYAEASTGEREAVQDRVLYFSHVCGESCVFHENMTDYRLLVDVADGVLNLSSLVYSKEKMTQNESSSVFLETKLLPAIEASPTAMQIVERRFDSTSELGPNWVRHCDGSNCSADIYLHDVNVLDNDGKYKPFENIVKLIKISDQELLLQWFDNSLKISFQNVNISQTDVFNQLGSYIWENSFSLESFNDTPQVEITGNKELFVENDTISFQGIEISFADAHIKNHFTIESQRLTNKKIRVRLTKDYKKFNYSLADAIVIDPIIQQLDNASTVQNDGYINRTTGGSTQTTRVTTSRILPVGSTCDSAPSQTPTQCTGPSDGLSALRIFFDWNVPFVPNNVHIQNINFTFVPVGLVNAFTNFSFRDMTTKSTAYADTLAGNNGLFIEIGNGTLYAVRNFTIANITHTVDLGTGAGARLEGNINNTDKTFSYGIIADEPVRTGNSPSTIAASEYTDAPSFVPVLTVFYVSGEPLIDLNGPFNGANVKSRAIDLNGTVTDPNDLILNVIRIFGNNNTGDIGIENLLFENRTNSTDASLNIPIKNGTFFNYSWLAPPITAYDSNGVIALFHFDNRSEFLENDTRVIDFAGRSGANPSALNASIINGNISSPIWNFSGGILGGSYYFSGVINNNISLGDRDDLTALTISYVFWVKVFTVGGNQSLMDKFQAITNSGIRFFMSGSAFHVILNGTVTAAKTMINYSGFFTPNQWIHVGVVFNGSAILLYKDGSLVQTSKLITAVTTNNVPLFIGATGQTNLFNGTIDEFAAFNRTLTPGEMVNLSNLSTSGKFCWYANARDRPTIYGALGNTTLEGNASRCFTVSQTTANNVPTINAGPFLYPGGANTTDQLNCTFTVQDNDYSDLIYVNVSFLNQSRGIMNFTEVALANNTNASFVLTPGLQAKNEVWTCQVALHDDSGGTGGNNGVAKNSSSLTIANSIPTVPPITLPADSNITTNRTPYFQWNSSFDADSDDGDVVTYIFNLTCISRGTSSCSRDNFTVHALTTNSTYFTLRELAFFDDDNFFYNWTVLATDNVSNSSWAVAQNFTVQSLVSISLTINTTDFGTRLTGTSIDTESAGIPTLQLSNDGNSLINVTLFANTSLWLTRSLNNESFQFKIGNVSGENFAYNDTSTQLTYRNVIATNVTAVQQLNYTDTSDEVKVHFNITVPDDEPAGNKESLITFLATYAGVKN